MQRWYESMNQHWAALSYSEFALWEAEGGGLEVWGQYLKKKKNGIFNREVKNCTANFPLNTVK